MESTVPLISTSTKGPLGIVHLPRLWLKLLLAAEDRLADGYRSGEGGFDGLLLDGLGIPPDVVVEYVSASKPNYLEFEAWVAQNASPLSLENAAVTALNDQILSFSKPEPGRSEMLEDLGLPNDETVWTGTALNDLDDWLGFHRALRDG